MAFNRLNIHNTWLISSKAIIKLIGASDLQDEVMLSYITCNWLNTTTLSLLPHNKRLCSDYLNLTTTQYSKTIFKLKFFIDHGTAQVQLYY